MNLKGLKRAELLAESDGHGGHNKLTLAPQQLSDHATGGAQLPSRHFKVHRVRRVVHVQELVNVGERIDARPVDVRPAYPDTRLRLQEAAAERPQRSRHVDEHDHRELAPYVAGRL